MVAVWLMPLAIQYSCFCIMSKPRLSLKCSLVSLARLSNLPYGYLLTTLNNYFVLSSIYLVEYTFYPNSIIEIAPEL